MDGRRAEGLLLGALAAFLLVGALRAFFSTIYWSNLAALSLQPSAALALLLLLAPVLYVVPVPRALLASALLLGLGRVAMSLAWPGEAYLAAAAVAAAGGMLLLPALAVDAKRRGGEAALLAVACGLGLGLALDAALLALGRSIDPTVGRLGLVVTVPAALALAAFAWRGSSATATPIVPRPTATRVQALAAGLALGALVFLEHAVLGSPHHLARWNGQAVAPYTVAVVLGLLLPLLLLARGRRPSPLALAALNAAALAAVLDHALAHGPLLPLLVFLAQAALVYDAAALLPWLAGGSERRAGLAFAAGALLTLVLHFAFVFSFTFAYVPLEHAWKGIERVLVPAAFLGVAIPALAAARDRPLPDARPPPRRVAWSAIGLALLLTLAAVAAPAATIPTPPRDAPIKVMTFNLHQAFSNAGVVDVGPLERVLREEMPDIVALQESDSPRITSANADVVGRLAATLGYHAAYGPPTSAQSFGVGLLSRYPIEAWDAVQVPSREDNRYYVEARLDVHGTDVWVYAVHLGLPARDRIEQNEALLARAATRDGPVILAGDFNSCPTPRCPEYEGDEDDVYARVTAQYVDTRVAAGLPANDADALTYEATRPHERIDYVFVSPHFDVASQATIRSEAALAASDHLPVVAVVGLA